MSVTKAIELLKSIVPYTTYTTTTSHTIAKAIKELETNDLQEELQEICSQVYRPKCSWCNDCLQSDNPFKDGKGGEYCSVACMLTSQDHDKIAALEAWKDQIDKAFYPR
jgi:hypothetical protein